MKVFYLTTIEHNVFYVRAETSAEAKDHLLEQVKKYFFKRDLADDNNMQSPATLGKNIIVELGVHREILNDNESISADDITAMAYIFSSAGKEYWKEWNLSTEDVLQSI